MRQNHVTVFYVHGSGSAYVSAQESAIIFARAYGVGTVLVDIDWADLHFTPFGELHLRKLSDEERENRHPHFIEPYEQLWNSYTADDWLDATTDECIVIPVSTIDFRDGSEGTYADLAHDLRTPVAVG